MKRIRLINLILIMFCCCNMLAQNITVTGQVVDVTSEPIIGASVVVKGTTNGTITDFDGNFTLSVQKGETLHISYIGYVAQDVKVMGKGWWRICQRQRMQDGMLFIPTQDMKTK